MTTEQLKLIVAQNRAKRVKEMRALRNRLEIKHAVPNNHPKAARLFELAWQYGHSAGHCDSEAYYGEMVELVKL